MIAVDSFRIRSVVDIIHELFQVKEVPMKYLNKFNIVAGIQNFTALLKSKDTLLPVHQLNAIKCAVAVILCVDFDIYMQHSCPKESSFLDNVQKEDH